MQPLSRELKFKLFFLALIFPISFAIIGWTSGIYLHHDKVALIIAGVGLLIGILLNVICYFRKLFTVVLYQTPIPLALFLLTWWISSSLVSGLMAFIIAIGGLLLGLWLNQILVLPYQFYKIKKRFLAIIYIFFSIACLGFFMGVPVFNILLGILAGNHLSIRVIRNYKSKKVIEKNLVQGALYTSIILFVITLFSGIIASSDIQNSIQIAESVLGIPLNNNLFYTLIIVGGILIILLQYYLTLFTARTMLQLWQHRRTAK